jgi:NAD(P)-dependent dehydrogenase (short-subunit alcohol dehydrogenase family)
MGRDRNNVVDIVHQSKPVDTSETYDPSWVAGKTIIITGGASGFGEGFSRHWAANGANIIIGDINDTRGEALVEDMRKSTGSQHHHYIHCDVTNWQSQVDLFHTAIKLSPSGGIDSVVANAGITDGLTPFDDPKGLDADTPPKPNWKCFEVNMVGVMYTAHLAIYYLQRNPRSAKASPSQTPAGNTPDRHLLLLGSVASLAPIPGQIQYAISKHGVLGLFRSLRSTAFMNGIRVNMLCPYFIDTPIIPAVGRAILAGAAMGKPEDVVDAGTRFMADTRIVGRALAVGPKVKTDDDWQLLPKTSEEGKEIAVWEVYAHDFEEVGKWTSNAPSLCLVLIVSDAFTARFVRLLNRVEIVRGWAGWFTDILKAVGYGIGLIRR